MEYEAEIRTPLERLGAVFSPPLDAGDVVESILESGTDALLLCPSPVGEVFVGVGKSGVRLVRRADVPAEEFAACYRRRFRRLLRWADDARLGRMVSAALAGEGTAPVDISHATSFQRRVLEVVSGIPRGEVRPYSWVAREAGSPRATRAVGNVMASNPVPLIIPCHRVVRNDGSTGNYAFGSPIKRRLLASEGVPVEQIAGSLYVATPTTGVFCHATCHHARRIKPENRRPFRSAREASDAGYRPCRVCRPVVAS
ncbi:methylated-DNA--[protein]-cysteine S-methyltransferase [Rubrobacter calidifluminis]|uniref:methylated-DNA--[protein]-cysteine S-methyltransferase n=1 Tax=Rubrobacter calidifluminis TaxID=1392640 RepID=UPI00235E89FC|nr:methylated-DNA--[protein]-cysteine S-methyltransferase [Rubrobacter calidifluminis]